MSTVVVLQAGVARARLLPEFGGRVSALLLATGAGESAVEVLHPYPEDFFDPLRWGKGGIYPLLPYSNRVAQACVRVDGVEVELVPHPDAAPHTLHGNAHTLPWRVVEQQPDRAVMVLESARCAAWPWSARSPTARRARSRRTVTRAARVTSRTSSAAARATRSTSG